jgi:GNAT superfamily N-acetyltransferase
MYVVPEYRGAGVAKRILDALEQLARERGFEAVRLDTQERLGQANRLCRVAGYREIEDYNGNPSANRWFEKPRLTFHNPRSRACRLSRVSARRPRLAG